MSSKDRVGQLKDQLQDAKEKGDDDKVLQIETELFQMRDKKLMAVSLI